MEGVDRGLHIVYMPLSAELGKTLDFFSSCTEAKGILVTFLHWRKHKPCPVFTSLEWSSKTGSVLNIPTWPYQSLATWPSCKVDRDTQERCSTETSLP